MFLRNIDIYLRVHMVSQRIKSTSGIVILDSSTEQSMRRACHTILPPPLALAPRLLDTKLNDAKNICVL
jgi:hypothetical protein